MAVTKGDAIRESQVASLVRELYRITSSLERLFPGRHFTPDGHLVGSIGEALASERYDLKLFEASHPVHDGISPDGRLVQIKATQRSAVPLSECPDHLIVLELRPDGSCLEVYNGPGEPAWAAAGKMQKTGQRRVSLASLRRLMVQVSPEDRIPEL